eukprot:1668313-Rhodomonas_salina.2
MKSRNRSTAGLAQASLQPGGLAWGSWAPAMQSTFLADSTASVFKVVYAVAGKLLWIASLSSFYGGCLSSTHHLSY